MTLVALIVTLVATVAAHAQEVSMGFLHGTWKIDGRQEYEHWDKLSEYSYKGLSYRTEGSRIVVSEYLDVEIADGTATYTATVLRQNQGRGVRFTLTRWDSVLVFENAAHDFPKKIVYERVSDTVINVRVSDGGQKGFAYKMRKLSMKNDNTDGTNPNPNPNPNPNYNHALAKKLGGDEYGMKGYYLVILRTGENKSTDEAFINDRFRQHLQNINRLVTQGIMVVAGPLGKNANNYRGIFVLQNVKSIEEAHEILITDPAISSGLLSYDIYSWYGSAALPEYLPFSDQIWKAKP